MKQSKLTNKITLKANLRKSLSKEQPEMPAPVAKAPADLKTNQLKISTKKIA